MLDIAQYNRIFIYDIKIHELGCGMKNISLNSAVIFVVFALLLILQGCGGGGISNEKLQIPPRPPEVVLKSDNNASLRISARSLRTSLRPGEKPLFMITFADENGDPYYLTAQEVTAAVGDQNCEVFPSIPATSPEIEEENRNNGDILKRKYDHWIIQSGTSNRKVNLFSRSP